eukprot:11225369-Lingulodinium_polyedra.AAC.1
MQVPPCPEHGHPPAVVGLVGIPYHFVSSSSSSRVSLRDDMAGGPRAGMCAPPQEPQVDAVMMQAGNAH